MPEKTITKAAGYREGTLRPSRGSARGAGGDERQDRVQGGGQLVDRRGERAEAATRVEQVRDRAEQVAEQVPVAGHGVDAHVDEIRPHDEAEQVEGDRLQLQ